MGAEARRRRGRERGVSLIEVVVAVAIMTLLFISLFGSMISSLALSASANDDAAALAAARDTVEAIKTTPFADVFATWFTAGGRTFTVNGLPRPTDGSDHGRIRFLSESELAAATGVDVDIDQDGNSGGTAPSAAYKFFPIEVTVRFGTRQKDTRTIRILTAAYETPAR